jgi:HSP20 family protein
MLLDRNQTGGDKMTATREQKTTAVPHIDIYEKDEELLLVAEMPGVNDSSASVDVDNGLLTIEGDITREVEEGFCPVRAERRADAFRRTFEISDSIDTAKITANMKYGVLTLKLPRREERKPRKIEVSAA